MMLLRVFSRQLENQDSLDRALQAFTDVGNASFHCKLENLTLKTLYDFFCYQ